MNAGSLIYLGSGRLATTTKLPVGTAANALPFASGQLCVAPGIAPRYWVSGIPYGQNARIAIDDNTVPVVSFTAGIGITAAGRVATDSVGAIAGYVRGIPVTAQGRVCIQAPTP